MWRRCSVTYSVQERPQGEGAVHAASCDDHVCSQVQAAADWLSPAREGGVCLQEERAEASSVVAFSPQVGVHAVKRGR